MDQLVFFKLTPKKGVAVPLCETEVMLGTGFGTHPDFKATVEEVERLLDVNLGHAPEPPPPAPTEATEAPPATSSGCW